MLYEVIKFNKLAKEFIQKEDVYQYKNSLSSFL